MRTSLSRPLLLVIGLLATLLSPQTIPAQRFIPYIGGGLRLGYIFGEGLSLGAEVTLGVFVPIVHTSIAFGILSLPTAPKIIRYVSGAGGVATLIAAGAAVGKTFYSLDGKNYSGTRIIVWAGPPATLVSLESYEFPNLDTQKKALALWRRMWLPLVPIHIP